MTEILCTLGPTSLNDRVIGRFDELGVDLFRLNLSHIEVDELRGTIEYIRSRSATPICLDSEGSQVLHRGNEVVGVPFTDKDLRAFEIGRELGVDHVALSFAHSADDVEQMRSCFDPGVFAIAKIECLRGIDKLDTIAQSADALLIDRGDLSRQVAVERIPRVQKEIIRVCREMGRPVYVATNLLESMTHTSVPTAAEANDVFNTLLDGADGLVLAGETAIGKYPVECVEMVQRMIVAYEEAL